MKINKEILLEAAVSLKRGEHGPLNSVTHISLEHLLWPFFPHKATRSAQKYSVRPACSRSYEKSRLGILELLLNISRNFFPGLEKRKWQASNSGTTSKLFFISPHFIRITTYFKRTPVPQQVLAIVH